MKDEFKGTPGPWELDQFDNVVHGKPDSWNRKETLRVSGVALPGRVTEEYAANTMLVAAAPELLEALRQLRDYVEDTYPTKEYGYAWAEDSHPMSLARAAIAKALGETK